METAQLLDYLYATGTITGIALSTTMLYYVTCDIMQEAFDFTYRRENDRLHENVRKLHADNRKLEASLSLWKKACDNLDKEVVENEAEKASTTT
ncbi:MAG: hypothetical protein V3S69_03455 [Dehalococcoidales bacterium]